MGIKISDNEPAGPLSDSEQPQKTSESMPLSQIVSLGQETFTRDDFMKSLKKVSRRIEKPKSSPKQSKT